MTFEKKERKFGGEKFSKFNNKSSKFGSKFGKFNKHKSNGESELKQKDRIAKRLAILGIASRREAEKLVMDGKVRINGVISTDLSYLVSYMDTISVNGREITNKPIRSKIFIFNKPAGYVTTTSDPQGRKNIFELIPSKFGRLITIGRLDFNTSGILLLTNNGELARVMEMPATALKRIYFAKVVGDISEEVKEKLENLKKGIKIEGIEYGKMIVEIVDYSKVKATLKIIIFEGKNNEIRRVMWHLGLKVIKLARVQYGDFKLMGLPEGCIQESRLKVDLRDLERRASVNAKRYNEKKAKQENNDDKKDKQNGSKSTAKDVKNIKEDDTDENESFNEVDGEIDEENYNNEAQNADVDVEIEKFANDENEESEVEYENNESKEEYNEEENNEENNNEVEENDEENDS